MYWSKAGKSYRLIDWDDVLCETDTVAIGFSVVEHSDSYSYILHKIGDPDDVKKWLYQTQSKYYEAGLFNEIKELVMIDGDEWDVDELNKVMDISGYVPRFLLDIGVFDEKRSNGTI